MTQKSAPNRATLDRLKEVLGADGFIEAPEDMDGYLSEPRGRWFGATPFIARPKNTDEMSAVLCICADTKTAVVPQSGNTGLVGGQIPLGHEILVSTSRMTRIIEIDRINNTMTVESGVVLSDIQHAASQSERLFPLSLASEGSARIGGLLSTNAGGNAVLRYGMARDLVLGLEVVTPQGEIWSDLNGLRKDNTGYDLKHLFMGAEGTLGIITAATLKLFSQPRQTETAFLAIPNLSEGLALLGLARQMGGDMISAFELIPRIGIDFQLAHYETARDPIQSRHEWYVLMELTTSMEDLPMHQVMERIFESAVDQGLVLDGALATSESQRQALWALRENLSDVQKKEGASLKHDVSVAVSAIPQFMEDAITAVRKIIPDARPVPFGHVGDGNIHFNISQPKPMDRETFEAKRAEVAQAVHEIVAGLGGSFSAEHGIGVDKAQLMRSLKDQTALGLMSSIKSAIDPDGIMNPGKIF